MKFLCYSSFSPLLLRFSCYFKSVCTSVSYLIIDHNPTLTVVIILFRGLVTLGRTRWQDKHVWKHLKLSNERERNLVDLTK